MPTKTSVIVPGIGQLDMWLQPSAAPTLLHFASTASLSLDAADYNVLPVAMWTLGWNVASFDIPGHGANLKPSETYPGMWQGLVNWASRAAADENIAATASAQISLAVAWLVQNGKTSPGRIAASGISRGGFVALAAISVPEVTALVGLNPVVDLSGLSEFAGLLNNWVVRQSSIGNTFSKGKACYIESSNTDTRVDCARTLHNVANVLERNMTGSLIELKLSSASGHVVPVGAENRAASWLTSKIS